MTTPSGIRLVAAAPKDNASGRAPSDMARLVIRIGLKRCVAAWITASDFFIPFNRLWLANSTIRIPFLVTRPISMIIPI